MVEPQHVYWEALRWLALEHLDLSAANGSIYADSLIVGSYETSPLRLRYEIDLDDGWNVTTVRVEKLGAAGETIALFVKGVAAISTSRAPSRSGRAWSRVSRQPES